MTWVATAVIGGSLVGAGASIYGSNKAADAARRGADASAQVQWDMYDQNRTDLAPWRQVGGQALNAYAAALGLEGAQPPPMTGPLATAYDVDQMYQRVLGRRADPAGIKAYLGMDAEEVLGILQESDEYGQRRDNKLLPSQQQSGGDRYGGFRTSPGYQWRLNQGRKALDRDFAGRGNYKSGQRMKAAMRYNQGVASDEFGNYMNRLASTAGLGQTAATNTASLGSAAAGNIGNAYQRSGDARASGYLGAANAVTSGINNALWAVPYWREMGRG